MAGVPRVLLPEGAQVLAVLIGLLIKASVELSQGLTSLLEEAMSLAEFRHDVRYPPIGACLLAFITDGEMDCRRTLISVIRCRSVTAFRPNRIGEYDTYYRACSTNYRTYSSNIHVRSGTLRSL